MEDEGLLEILKLATRLFLIYPNG